MYILKTINNFLKKLDILLKAINILWFIWILLLLNTFLNSSCILYGYNIFTLNLLILITFCYLIMLFDDKTKRFLKNNQINLSSLLTFVSIFLVVSFYIINEKQQFETDSNIFSVVTNYNFMLAKGMIEDTKDKKDIAKNITRNYDFVTDVYYKDGALMKYHSNQCFSDFLQIIADMNYVNNLNGSMRQAYGNISLMNSKENIENFSKLSVTYNLDYEETVKEIIYKLEKFAEDCN